MADYPQEVIGDLVDRNLNWDQYLEMMRLPKGEDRFLKYRRALQERVDWDDPIILPYAEHLYIVAKPDDQWLIKCDCGHEFCDHDENWKLHANINVRDTDTELQEIYPEHMHIDPDWQELREYFCPGCNRMLAVEAEMPWYPPVHNFQPDIETFYGDWLNEPIPTAGET